ncbi:MAG: hypothetical protein ACRDV3_10305, partial [Acidothermaceae bacterium]
MSSLQSWSTESWSTVSTSESTTRTPPSASALRQSPPDTFGVAAYHSYGLTTAAGADADGTAAGDGV